MYTNSVASLARGLRQKEFSSVELSRCFLDRIAAFNKLYNAYITVDEQSTMGAAEAADARLIGGTA
ncbi:MAG: Asp-tRNA(Asn)/Glu-tRNA(Gln) amidotransferase GatCAB subunit A, partial [Halieaceae bacterium]|nr:Asp-tRNA(Asn)/Glu-tRNA(Gln) amidotransferase GatCAB subunit A [Halieaceae bacterium]